MNIIQVLDAFYPAEAYGGVLLAEKIIEKLNHRYSTSVVTTDLKTLAPVQRLLETPKQYYGATIRRARAYRLPKLLPIVSPKALILLFSEISKTKEVIIIHSHTYLSINSLFAAFARIVCPRVRFVHQPHFHPFPGGTRRGYFARRFYDYTVGKLILRMADKIIIMSEAEKDNLLNIFKDYSKIILIPHGVRSSMYVPIKKKFRRRLGIQEKDFVILCVSRVGSEQVDFFIRLIRNVSKRMKTVIVGGVWGKNMTLEKLNKKIERAGLKGRIYITGYLSESLLIDVYYSSNIFIKPTHFEAFGIVFLEAMSAGLPILSHRVGSLPELIEEGVNGFLFEEDEIEQMSEKINELALNKNLRDKIAKNNREKAKKFLWDNILVRYIELYENLAKELTNRK